MTFQSSLQGVHAVNKSVSVCVRQTFVNRVVADTIFAPSYNEVRQSVAGAFDKRAAEGDASESVGTCVGNITM